MCDERFILDNMAKFELLSVSSNRVYRFTQGDEGYILKVSYLTMDKLSPFWKCMHRIFNSSFQTQRENIENTLAMLENPHIPTAQLVAKSNDCQYQLFKEVQGAVWQPDEFPDREGIHYQLGQFIGFLHSKEYGYYGLPNAQLRSGFQEKMMQVMDEIVEEYWADSQQVKAYLDRLRSHPRVPDSYSLVMPDISANQFIFSKDLTAIQVVVDLDAYVIGPREWELTVIEMCLAEGEAFKLGYEQYRKFPDLNGHREYYRFLMYLCDPWEKQDFNSFMSRSIRF